jgi:hypothetical protein
MVRQLLLYLTGAPLHATLPECRRRRSCRLWLVALAALLPTLVIYFCHTAMIGFVFAGGATPWLGTLIRGGSSG